MCSRTGLPPLCSCSVTLHQAYAPSQRRGPLGPSAGRGREGGSRHSGILFSILWQEVPGRGFSDRDTTREGRSMRGLSDWKEQVRVNVSPDRPIPDVPPSTQWITKAFEEGASQATASFATAGNLEGGDSGDSRRGILGQPQELVYPRRAASDRSEPRISSGGGPRRRPDHLPGAALALLA